MKKTAVYLGACEEYNPEKIAAVILDAVRRIGLKKPVRGRVVIKPNLVIDSFIPYPIKKIKGWICNLSVIPERP